MIAVGRSSSEEDGGTMVGKRMRRRVVLALVATAVGAALWGSAGAAGGKPTLVVYSAQGYDKAMVDAFQKATGIPTKLDDNSTGPLLTQVEASKNNPHWGLLWVDGDTAFAGLDAEGMLMTGWEPKVKWNALGKQVVPKDGSYIPTHVTFMAAMLYDPSQVSNPPTTWQQLLQPKWKGAVGMNDPSQSGPTYPFVAGMMQYLGGIMQGEDFFTKLKTAGLVINPTNGPTIQALTSGQIKLALVQSSAAVGAKLDDSKLAVKYLNPQTLLPGAIGIDAKASPAVQAEAKKFVEFVLSKRGQKVMQTGDPSGDSLYYPVIKGVKPLKALPAIGSVQSQVLNPYLWGPREPTINNWFDSHIVH
jgi:iron(III) transport system substrate-binding protein